MVATTVFDFGVDDADIVGVGVDDVDFVLLAVGGKSSWAHCPTPMVLARAMVRRSITLTVLLLPLLT